MTMPHVHHFSEIWQVAWLPKLCLCLFILFGFAVLARLVRLLFVRLSKLGRHPGQKTVILLLGQLAHGLVWVIGAITALGSLGVNVSALVASFGLTGVAVSFAVKDVLSNSMAGLSVLLYQPFVVGQTVEIAGVRGEVTAIDLRYTRLATTAGDVLVPNAKLVTDTVRLLSNTEGSPAE